jgi:hypothetical protein
MRLAGVTTLIFVVANDFVAFFTPVSVHLHMTPGGVSIMKADPEIVVLDEDSGLPDRGLIPFTRGGETSPPRYGWGWAIRSMRCRLTPLRQ